LIFQAQKAGVPERAVNEIHGAWFDPSNPVVQFNQNLRGDLFERLLKTEEKTDLCLCVGTSLSGMNADRMVESPAKRKVKKNKGLGAVIINLQRTRLDDICSLRIWADADTVFALLAKQLQISSALIARSAPIVRTLVPYDGDGMPQSDPLMLLDVSEGQEVVVGQPSDNEFRHRKGQIDDIDEFGSLLLLILSFFFF
jgi:hypothetical protein